MSTRPYEFAEKVERGSAIIPVSATSLKYTNCEAAYMNAVINGYRESNDNDILRVGTAVHKYAEIANSAEGREDPSNALLEALDSLGDDFAHCRDEVMRVCSASPPLPPPVPLKGTGVAKEVPIVLPWRRYWHNGRWYHIVLCATLDLITHSGGVLNIVDYKTTRYYNIQDAERKYEQESQFFYYMWLLRNFGHRVLEFEYANLAREYKMFSTPYFIQISSKGTRWVWGKPRSLTTTVEAMFEHQLNHTIDNFILPMWFGERAPSRTGWLGNSCQRCNFISVCFEPDADMLAQTLRLNFREETFGERYMERIEYV
jgi:hypothetical protein